MHSTITYAGLALAMNIATIHATPMVGTTGPCAGGAAPTTYKITSQKLNQAGTPIVGDYACPGTAGGCQLQDGESYSVSVTVEVGADLGLNFDDIASAGVSGSVSTTTESGTTQSVGLTCPDGPWHCALLITPAGTVVSGTQTKHGPACEALPSSPFTVWMPEKGANGKPASPADVEVCACKNYKHWDDKASPPKKCPVDCPR